jgi:DUF971 family protein
MKNAWPVELRWKKKENHLCITFDDGIIRDLPAKFLREKSPSAEMRGHGGVKPASPASIDPNVQITSLDPVGNYAVRITFSDGHDTGLFTWDYLYGLKA